MMDNELAKKINEVHTLLVKLENYIKVTDYEGYCQVNKLIEFTDYSSSLDYLKKIENLVIKEQLDYDYRMMTRARVKQDFLGFCRYTWLQMELMIVILLEKMENSNKLKSDFKGGNFPKEYTYKGRTSTAYMRDKIRIAIDAIQYKDKSPDKDNILSEKMQKIYDLRNEASHR